MADNKAVERGVYDMLHDGAHFDFVLRLFKEHGIYVDRMDLIVLRYSIETGNVLSQKQFTTMPDALRYAIGLLEQGKETPTDG